MKVWPILATALAATGIFTLAPRLAGQEVRVEGIATASPKRADKVVLSDEEWRKRLTPEQFRILRGKGTEPAFCGVNLDHQ
ncbi:MAG: hypothetical protein SNJ61_04065, partial [Fimbriimonadaceae bacterium]